MASRSGKSSVDYMRDFRINLGSISGAEQNLHFFLAYFKKKYYLCGWKSNLLIRLSKITHSIE